MNKVVSKTFEYIFKNHLNHTFFMHIFFCFVFSHLCFCSMMLSAIRKQVKLCSTMAPLCKCFSGTIQEASCWTRSSGFIPGSSSFLLDLYCEHSFVSFFNSVSPPHHDWLLLKAFSLHVSFTLQCFFSAFEVR